MGKSAIAQNIETRVVSIDKLNPSTYNPRVDLTESDAEYQHIKNSLESFGYLDPIVWNERTGNIISGHQRYKILVADGATELEVKVVDFDLETEKACNLAMNKATGLWDEEKLNALLLEMENSPFNMEDFGFIKEELDNTDISNNPYTQKTSTPIYEPTGDEPPLEALVDTSKTDELLENINKADIPTDIKKFLTLASYRHLRFNYRDIAEYYCHAPKDVQELFEESALVIIDFQKAIENGFVRLTSRIEAMIEGLGDAE